MTNDDGIKVKVAREFGWWGYTQHLIIQTDPVRSCHLVSDDDRVFDPVKLKLEYNWNTKDLRWDLMAVEIMGPSINKDGTYGDDAERDCYDPHSGTQAPDGGGVPDWLLRLAEQRAKLIPDPPGTQS